MKMLGRVSCEEQVHKLCIIKILHLIYISRVSQLLLVSQTLAIIQSAQNQYLLFLCLIFVCNNYFQYYVTCSFLSDIT